VWGKSGVEKQFYEEEEELLHVIWFLLDRRWTFLSLVVQNKMKTIYVDGKNDFY